MAIDLPFRPRDTCFQYQQVAVIRRLQQKEFMQIFQAHRALALAALTMLMNEVHMFKGRKIKQKRDLVALGHDQILEPVSDVSNGF